MDDLTTRLEEARNLREEDELEASQEIFLELLNEYPDNTTVLYEVGGSYDLLGEEREAIPFYEKAIEVDADRGLTRYRRAWA